MKNSNNNSNKKNSNNNSNKNNTNTNEANKTRAELLEELQKINISISILYIIIITLILDLTLLYNDRAKIFDEINNTKNAEYSSIVDLYRTISRKLTLFVAIVNVKNRSDDLNDVLSISPINEESVRNAKQSLLASILILLAIRISQSAVIINEV